MNFKIISTEETCNTYKYKEVNNFDINDIVTQRYLRVCLVSDSSISF